jgi:predicted lipoprotein
MLVNAGLRQAATALALICLLAGPAAADAPGSFDHAALARRALERHIQPGYAKLAAAAGELSERMKAYCADSGPPQRKAVEEAFDGFVTAWGRIEHIAFGPVTADNHKERILFWPDRRGLGARQVTKALAGRDPALLDPHALAGKSVALQGLGALELALFGQGGEAGDAEARTHRCRYGAAVAANLATITRAVADEWTRGDGFARSWLAPGTGNPVFLKPAETTLALAKSFDQGIERVRDERLGGPLGLGPQRHKTPALLATSGRTLRLACANIEGLQELFTEGGMREAVIAGSAERAVDVAAKAKVVASELATARAIASEVIDSRRPFEGETARRLIAMGFPLKNARVLTGELLALTAGLTFGFNASDGD